jgi:hypothetical protein
MVSLLTKVTRVPTPVVTSAGVTPVDRMVTTAAAGADGDGGAGATGTGVGAGDGADGAPPDSQPTDQQTATRLTRAETIFVRGNRERPSMTR